VVDPAVPECHAVGQPSPLPLSHLCPSCPGNTIHQFGPHGRFGFNSILTERTWRENYWPAWEACVAAGARGVMCSYNAITLSDNLAASNNVPACANALTLTTLLRNTWNLTNG